MKKQKKLNDMEIAFFCEQLTILLQSGITPYEAILLLHKDTDATQGKEIFEAIEASLRDGLSFHDALLSTQLFPDYLIQMVALGEESGNLDIIMQRLNEYYEQQYALSKSIKNALTYPILMVCMMICILVVLLTKVLPIFHQVFLQLGSGLTGISLQLMTLGNLINSASAFFIIMAVLVCLLILAVKFVPKLNSAFKHFMHTNPLTKNFYLQIAYSRFASALALTVASGMDTHQGLILASKLVDNSCMQNKFKLCLDTLRSGENLAQAITQADIFHAVYQRMLHIGFRSGKVDNVLRKISEHYENETNQRIQHILAAIEPSLVIVFSLMVGLILISVMMPLIGIMSSIG